MVNFELILTMIQVTDSAASHLLALLKSNDHSPEEKGLRLLVERGGCAGMSYAMQIASASPGDDVIEKMGVKVFVDRESLDYLDGCQLDYVDALNDSGFKIKNPNAARSCGCGTSFEPVKADKKPEYDPETMDGENCNGSR